MWVHTACLINLGYCHFVYNAPFLYAGITQWLERQFSKLKVVGSSPITRSTWKRTASFSFTMHSKQGVVGSSPTRSTYLWLAVTFSIGTAISHRRLHNGTAFIGR